MPISDGRSRKSFDELLNNPDIKDQFAIPYPLGADIKVPAVERRPWPHPQRTIFSQDVRRLSQGRGAQAAQAGRVDAGPSTAAIVSVTSVNGVKERLAEVVKELETLPADLTQYLVPSAGTYNCRTIANTSRLSVHAFGAAIDINAKFADYWEWSKGKDGKVVWKNRIPGAIGEIFERHGFIWGAKWYHFDSMHFEYRPELIALARQGWPTRP